MKQGRNEACFCGSGKKYKSCHGQSPAAGKPDSVRPTESRMSATDLIQRALRLHQSGKLNEARALYSQALSLDPENPDAIHFMGYIAYQTGNAEQALKSMQRSIALNPQASQYHGNLGMVFMQLERFDEAEAAFNRSLKLDPRNAESHNNFGCLWQLRGRYDLARDCFERAIAARPGYIDALNNLGTSLAEMRRFDEAAEQHQKALEIDSSNADAHFFLGFVRFNQSRPAEGWRGYEWRLNPALNPKYRVVVRPFPAPKWDGQELGGRTLLLHAEQGIGDQIWSAGMFDSLVPQVEKGARVLIECAPKLVPLFRRSFPWADVVERKSPPDPKCLHGVDFQISSGSLGRIVRPDLASFPSRASTSGAYLFADPEREAYWKKRISGLGTGLKIGVNWRSSNVKGERGLVCTQLLDWAAMLNIKGVHFVNLQYDECEEELGQAERKYGIRIERFSEVDMFDDLDETAALMRGLDIVVGAPTSVAIMSAALGVATWEMTSATEWQCFGQSNNPMYPAMQNYIKSWDQSWLDMLDIVAADLARKARTLSMSRALA